MGKFIDMTGWKMWEHGVPDSRWTVIERAEDYIRPSGGKSVAWLCECNCENHTRKIILGNELRNGTSKSCGCNTGNLKLEKQKQYYKTNYDLSGKQFGRLTVIQEVDPPRKDAHERFWLCECSCENHNKIIVSTSKLNSKHVQSCGCLGRERLAEYQKASIKRNRVDKETYSYGILWTNNTNKEVYFDLEDYEKIKNYTWYEDDKGYIVSKSNGHIIKLHRVVMGDPKGYQIDHKHGKNSRNDNRKSNLRIATNQKNSFNKGLYSTNTSGCTGVWWNKKLSKWCAEIKINGEKIHLGVFDKFEDAVQARQQAEDKYFGDFSYRKSQEDSIYVK